MNIEEEMAELRKRGFKGNSLEEAFKWLREEHGLSPLDKVQNETSLKQLILILKIRK